MDVIHDTTSRSLESTATLFRLRVERAVQQSDSFTTNYRLIKHKKREAQSIELETINNVNT